jgi:hypothetical protein
MTRLLSTAAASLLLFTNKVAQDIVYSIVFDKGMKYALVHYGMIMEGGHAFLKKENGKWGIISAKRIWQE